MNETHAAAARWGGGEHRRRKEAKTSKRTKCGKNMQQSEKLKANESGKKPGDGDEYK